jgi:rsbT co-antagonist protein RsbR
VALQADALPDYPHALNHPFLPNEEEMMAKETPVLSDLVRDNRAQLEERWVAQQSSFLGASGAKVDPAELRAECGEFLTALIHGVRDGRSVDLNDPGWSAMRDVITGISRSRAKLGFSTSETATFVFSLKRAIFEVLRRKHEGQELADRIWEFTTLLDTIGLWVAELYQHNREELIVRQQQEVLELSTPVVELWEGVLALPLIGTLDSSRTQVVMENLLQAIVDTGAGLAIIDITGVATVDTLVAQHLLKTVAAARLMGADCIISGIRPQIAQTIVNLGVELGDVSTKATLAAAFSEAIRRLGLKVVKAQS